MIRPLALTFLFAAPLAAQPATICQADFDTPIFNPFVSMGGPNLLLAIKLQATSAYTAARLEVFTGNQRGPNTLAIWSHDPVGNQPLAPLGSGSWEMSRLFGWQGCNLTPQVPLALGQDFWFVWGPQSGAQASVQANGAGAQPYRGSFTNGTSWTGPFMDHQWKLRIWCGLVPGSFEVFGSGCAGATRTVPELGWNGLPLLGTPFDLRLDRGAATSLAILTIGDSNTVFGTTPLPFSLAGFGAPGCNLLTSVLGNVFTTTDGAGQATVTLAIPRFGSLLGFRFYDQWFVATPGANPLGFLVSNGGAGTIGL